MARKQFVARVSDVQALHYVRTYEPRTPIETDEQWEKAQEWYPTEEKLLHELKNGVPENDAMLIGTLGHKVLETSIVGDEHLYVTDDENKLGLYFGEVELTAPFYLLKERRMFKTYQIGDTDFILTGQYDAKWNNRIIDYKFSASGDFETKYMDSFQWRAYLDLEGHADEFEYSVFETKWMSPNRRVGPKPSELGLNEDYQNYTVAGHESYVCHRYPDLAQHVRNHVEAFLAWSIDAGWKGRDLAQFK